MSDGPLVSIVVPVYNVEQYLDKCLGSIVGQTYKNIEIILVDDGSTDRSGAKCDTWKQKDKRVKVVHKKNEGLNYARRDGFKEVSGEYVTFLDSDDLFNKKNIEISLKEAIDNNADIVSYAFTKFADDSDTSELVTTIDLPERRVLNDKKSILEYVLLETGVFPNSHAITAWGKLYKVEVVQEVNWDISNYRSYEDNFWTPQLFAFSDKVILLSCPLYFYRRNEEYGIQGKTLGNRLTGNTYNGKPVGYIELISLSFEYYNKLAKDYKVDIEKNLWDKRYVYMKGRFDNLISAGLVDSENNLSYLEEVWTELSRRYSAVQNQNQDLRNRNTELEEQNTVLQNKNNELISSRSYRIGRKITGIYRAPKRFAQRVLRGLNTADKNSDRG